MKLLQQYGELLIHHARPNQGSHVAVRFPPANMQPVAVPHQVATQLTPSKTEKTAASHSWHSDASCGMRPEDAPDVVSPLVQETDVIKGIAMLRRAVNITMAK